MAGLTRRYCSTSCACDPVCEGVCISDDCTPFQYDDTIKGQCGNCAGRCQPCESDIPEEDTGGGASVDCGKWRDCDCALDACGDGHDCHRYIDIQFTLEEFVIQGKICCNASALPLTQQCNGALVDQETENPHIGTPSGWSASEDGISDYVIYEKTIHRIRLTKQDCDCFWGGYWSSSCDCNTCTCSNCPPPGEPVGTCEGDDIYPDCDCGYVITSFDLGCDSADWTQPCDPSIPCWPIDDGFASSFDQWGTEDVGGSDGTAICTAPSGMSPDNCGYRSDVCDDWIGGGSGGTPAHACWDCGSFKPHHIEAYFTYAQSSDTESCTAGWVLEIRGLTELTRSEYGLATSVPSYDCHGFTPCGTCAQACPGGAGNQGLGYVGRWWGVESICNLGTHCADEPYASGVQPPIPELVFHGCSCPPSCDIESTVRVDDTIAAFHPTGVFGGTGGDSSTPGRMHVCVVSDAQGSLPSETYCADAAFGGVKVCTGRNFLGFDDNQNSIYADGECYGPPVLWWNRCDYCDDCCIGDWGHGCDGCDCNPLTDPWCACVQPQGSTNPGDPGIPHENYPCNGCDGLGNDPYDLNHPSCTPCPTYGESRPCAPCSIMIRPNSNAQPWWAGGS